MRDFGRKSICQWWIPQHLLLQIHSYCSEVPATTSKDRKFLGSQSTQLEVSSSGALLKVCIFCNKAGKKGKEPFTSCEYDSVENIKEADSDVFIWRKTHTSPSPRDTCDCPETKDSIGVREYCQERQMAPVLEYWMPTAALDFCTKAVT